MSPTDTLLEEAAERLFGDLATPEVVNAAEAGTWPAALWQAVEDAGFADALIADRGPGDLTGFADAAAILSAAGRHAAPLPLPETMLGRWLLHAAGLAIPAGPLTIAVAGAAAGRSGEGGFELRRSAGGWHLCGAVGGVPWAREARGIVVLADGSVARLDPGSVQRRTVSLAGEPRDEVVVERTLDVHDGAAVASGVDGALLLGLGAAARAAQMAGALEGVLALAVQYANDRVQFGRPIGKFQAIQQQMAILAEEVAAAGVASAAAAEAITMTPATARFAIAAAKLRVGEAAGKAAEIAHQVHGAIGFTLEHRLHHLTRRLWSWRDEFGIESDWAMELGRLAAQEGADGLWPLLTRT